MAPHLGLLPLAGLKNDGNKTNASDTCGMLLIGADRLRQPPRVSWPWWQPRRSERPYPLKNKTRKPPALIPNVLSQTGCNPNRFRLEGVSFGHFVWPGCLHDGPQWSWGFKSTGVFTQWSSQSHHPNCTLRGRTTFELRESLSENPWLANRASPNECQVVDPTALWALGWKQRSWLPSQMPRGESQPRFVRPSLIAVPYPSKQKT